MSALSEIRAGVVTVSADETRALASQLASELPPDTTLALHGDLGTGKTTFVQGLAAGFGIKDNVTSPSFTVYTLHRGARTTLVHLDAYRLDSPHQFEALLVDDFLVSPWCLAIEWPEKIGAWLPADAIHLDFSILSDHRPEPAHCIALHRSP